MRVLAVPALRVVDAHVGESRQHRPPGGVPLQALVEDHRLLDLSADGLEGVEGGHGVLEDHGDLPAPDGEPLLFRGVSGQVLSAVEDVPPGDIAVLVQQAHEGLGEHALARAGLPHDGQGFPPVHVQGHAADGVEGAAPEVKLHVQVLDGQDDVCFCQGPGLLTRDFWGRRRRRRRCR